MTPFLRFIAIVASLVLLFPITRIILDVLGIYLELGNLIATVGTIELAFTALFQKQIQSWLRSPKLDCRIQMGPPDCHRVRLTELGARLNAAPEYRYYYRLRIENKGSASAKDVEVILMNVSQRIESVFKPLEAFPVDHLVWAIGETKQREIYRRHITPGVPVHCSLGYIIDPVFREHDEYKETEYNPDLGVDRKTAIFHFDVYFQSSILYYLVRPGIYRIEIMIAATNAKPKKKRFELKVTGFWSNVEKEMLAKGVKIIELK